VNPYTMAASLACIGVMVFLANNEGTLTSRQMRRSGITNGLSFLRNAGMWSEIVLLTPAIGIMCDYWHQWYPTLGVIVAVLLGYIFTIAAYMVRLNTATYDSHVFRPGHIRVAGIVHFFYLLCVVSITLLFFFCTDARPHDVRIVTCLVALHVAIANIGVGLLRNNRVNLPTLGATAACWAFLAYAASS